MFILSLSSSYLSTIHSRLTLQQESWAMPFTPLTFVNVTYSPIYEIISHMQFFNGILMSIILYSTDITVIEIFAQLVLRFKLLQNSFR